MLKTQKDDTPRNARYPEKHENQEARKTKKHETTRTTSLVFLVCLYGLVFSVVHVLSCHVLVCLVCLVWSVWSGLQVSWWGRLGGIAAIWFVWPGSVCLVGCLRAVLVRLEVSWGHLGPPFR